MTNSDLARYAEELVPARTRWLAIAAGCVSGLAGSLPFGPLFAALPAILVFSAILQRWSPRPGRWLMWLGAFFLTLDVGVFFIPPVLRPSHMLDGSILIVLSLYIVSILLVGCCDLALIIDSRRSRSTPDLTAQGLSRLAEGIIGLIALCLTVYWVWASLASFGPIRRSGRWDISLFNAPFVIAVAALDTAIVVHAVRKYRARRASGAAIE